MIRLSVFLIICAACLKTAVGQNKFADEGPVGIFSSKSEYLEFIGSAKKVAYGPNGTPELQAMIPLLNDIALNKPIGFTADKYDSQASTVGLLANKTIRSEIEMVDHQYEELKKVNARIQARVSREIRGLDFSKTETITTRIKSIRDRAQKELDAVLLPHQVKRLRQIHLQSQLRRRSLVDVITTDPLKVELKISDSQSEMLKKEEAKIQSELEEKIAELQAEARTKLLSKLKPDQKKQVDELVGDSFEFALSDKRSKKESNAGKKFKK